MIFSLITSKFPILKIRKMEIIKTKEKVINPFLLLLYKTGDFNKNFFNLRSTLKPTASIDKKSIPNKLKNKLTKVR